MHAEGDYARVWVSLYEDMVSEGAISLATGYPCRVNGHYIMSPSPIPRWDIRRLDNAPQITLLGAGREKRVYAVPPYTRVEPLEFEDVPFEVERFPGMRCARCGSTGTYLDEIYDETTGSVSHVCSDSGFCDLVSAGKIPARESRDG